jgi:hypothetical protein
VVIVLGSLLIIETLEIFYEVVIPKNDGKTLFASSNEVLFSIVSFDLFILGFPSL